MYTFADRDGTALTLRPEGTASVVRAYVEHALQAREPVSKLYYFGPMFRRERPQKGRLRQFSQIGAELLGRDDPAADAEILLLLTDLLADFGVANAELQINTLGDRVCQPAYRAALVEWGARKSRRAVRRLRPPAGAEPAPPARLQAARLCRDPPYARRAWWIIAARRVARTSIACSSCSPPKASTYACSRTWCADSTTTAAPPSRWWRTGSARRTRSAAAGATTGWCASSAGPTSPASASRSASSDWCSCSGRRRRRPRSARSSSSRRSARRRKRAALALAHRLRRGGARVDVEPGDRSLKSQMRHAAKLGARYVIILGEDELASGTVTVRDMEAKLDRPRVASLQATAAELRAALAGEVAERMERHA